MIKSTHTHSGFTIVELLIVVVVIAILAALTIVSYNGITNKAVSAGLQQELSGASKKVENYKTTNGLYPSSLAQAGVSVSNVMTAWYVASSSQGYCISYTKGAITYSVGSMFTKPTEGPCQPIGLAATLAGPMNTSNDSGYVDAQGQLARFDFPRSITVSASGDVYVGDNGSASEGCVVRKITPSGMVSTFAGSTTCGYQDGQGTTARFADIRSLTTDTAGNIFVADRYRIRKITPSGVVSTFAGTGSYGESDGLGTSASFQGINDIFFAPDGMLYVADNVRVRKVSPTGTVTTFAGSEYGDNNATGINSEFYQIDRLAVARDGTIYIVDGSCRIKRISASGIASYFVGSEECDYADGVASAVRFSSIRGLTTDYAGNLYVSDSANMVIRKVTPQAVSSTLAGSVQWYATDGFRSEARFSYPDAIVMDKNGVLYIVDNGNNAIRTVR